MAKTRKPTAKKSRGKKIEGEGGEEAGKENGPAGHEIGAQGACKTCRREEGRREEDGGCQEKSP